MILIKSISVTVSVCTKKMQQAFVCLSFSSDSLWGRPIAPSSHPCDVQWLAKVFTPLGIFPILLPYNLELKQIFGQFVSFDLHNMPTTLKMQNIFYVETNKK